LLSSKLAAISLLQMQGSEMKSEMLWRSDFFFLNTGGSFGISQHHKPLASWDSNATFFLPETSHFISQSFRFGLGLGAKVQPSANLFLGIQTMQLLPATQFEFRPWIAFGWYQNFKRAKLWEVSFGVVESPLHFFVYFNESKKATSRFSQTLGASLKIPIY
jgi:hypothetical protein